MKAIAEITTSWVARQSNDDQEIHITRIRDYEVIGKLGEGGMGRVFLARHIRLDKQVAIKILHPKRINDAESISRFQREMKAVGRLDHPNIISGMDAGEEQGLHYLVTEYVKGVDVGKVIQGADSLTVADACAIVRQTALGLAYVHDCHLIHRDVKPSNLMLTGDGTVKILDLGLAQLCHWTYGQSKLTHDGGWVGTLKYLAPELLHGEVQPDHRCDVYGLGATFCELLFGEVVNPNLPSNPPLGDLLGTRSDIPPSIVRLLTSMLAVDPKKRPDSCHEIAKALAEPSTAAQLPQLYQQTVVPLNSSNGNVVSIRAGSPSNEKKKTRFRIRHLGWGGVLSLLVLAAGWAARVWLTAGSEVKKTPWDIPTENQPMGTLLIEHINADLALILDQGNLVAKSADSHSAVRLKAGANQLVPGVYTIEPAPDGDLDGILVDARVEIHANLVVEPVLNFVPNIQPDFTVHLPRIPEQGVVRYACDLQRPGVPTPIPYQISLESWKSENYPDCGWLRMEITGPSLVETAVMLVNRDAYNRGERLHVREGWVSTPTPESQIRLRQLVGDQLVATYSPTTDALQELDQAWDIAWPARLSIQELLVLLFDADCPAASPEILFLRTALGASGERKMKPKNSFGPKGNVACIEVTDDDGSYTIQRSLDSNEVPFSLILIKVRKPGFQANLSLTDYSPSLTPTLVDRGELNRLSEKLRLVNQPTASSFMYGTLPDRSGSWVTFVGTAGPDQEIFDVKLEALNQTQVNGDSCRWLRIVSAGRSAHPIEATLLVQDELYAREMRFAVQAGWIRIDDACFPIGEPAGVFYRQCLHWLNKTVSAAPLSISDVLTLLFDADMEASRDLRRFRTQLSAQLVANDLQRRSESCKVTTRQGGSVPGQQWQVALANQNLEYKIQRSEQIPFGFGRTVLRVPQTLELISEVDDFGWEESFDPVDSEQLRQMAETTKQRLESVGVRNWKRNEMTPVFGKFVEFRARSVTIESSKDGDRVVVPFESLDLAARTWVFDQMKRTWSDKKGHQGTGVLVDFDRSEIQLMMKPDSDPADDVRIPITRLSDEDAELIRKYQDETRSSGR